MAKHHTHGHEDNELGIPLDTQEAKETKEKFSSLIVPGSKQDETLIPNLDHFPADQGDLEEHAKAAELDHPQGSVTTKHLEPQIRALLEALIQGDDEAVFREKTRFENPVTFEAAVALEAIATFADRVDVNALFVVDDTVAIYDWAADGTYGAITHIDRGVEKSASDYALLMSVLGTYVNTATGGMISFRVNNVEQMKLELNKVTFPYGGYIIGDGLHLPSGDWFRSYGSTGWYNGSHGGGIDMHDSTYVRTHGGRKFHCDNQLSAASVHRYNASPAGRTGYADMGENGTGGQLYHMRWRNTVNTPCRSLASYTSW